MDGRKDLTQEGIDRFGPVEEEVMSAFGDYMRWGGEFYGKDLVTGPVDMKKGLWDGRIIPLDHGAERPADELLVAGADYLAHQLSVRRPHGKGMLEYGGGLQEVGGDDPAQLQGACKLIYSGKMGGRWNAADQDGGCRRNAFRYLHRHDTAKGHPCDDEGLCGIYLLGEPEGIVAQLFFFERRDPMDVSGFESWR